MTDYQRYSQRRKLEERRDYPVPVRFDAIPSTMRIQTFYLIEALVNQWRGRGNDTSAMDSLWRSLEKRIREERGVLRLHQNPSYPKSELQGYLASEITINHFLDATEIALRKIHEQVFEYRFSAFEERKSFLKSSIDKLNRRFSEHDLGYEFVAVGEEPGFIVRSDSQFIHSQVVVPAVASLHIAGFHGPLDEFMEGHRKFRHGDNKGAIRDAGNAFESTMKAICQARRWTYDPNKATAHALIATIMDNGLFKDGMENVRASLENGVPVLRNRLGGHGQGADVKVVADHVAAYTLHLTASNIVLLMCAHSSKGVA